MKKVLKIHQSTCEKINIPMTPLPTNHHLVLGWGGAGSDILLSRMVTQRVKKSACNVGHLGLTPGSGRSPGEGNGNPLQYSCLENPTDRGAWWAIYSPWGHKESDTTEQLILSDILCAYYISLIKLIP